MQTLKKAQKNQFAFRIIAVLIPFFILAVLEGMLRLSGYGDNFSLFIQNPEKGYEEYMIVNPDVGKKYFQKLEYDKPGNDLFLKDKPENTFRIFVMGSSTVVGFPYDRNLMFSRIIHKQLEEAYPNKKIEVVNTAITAINSFTLLDYTDQILKYSPDAILIYAGHNEFYGAFGVGSNETLSKSRKLTLLHISLMDFKIYQLLRNIITGVMQKIPTGNNDYVEGTKMKRIVDNKDIQLGSEEYLLGIDNYRANMDDILKKISKKNIPVFLSEVVSNVEGMKPFGSNTDGISESAIDVFYQAQEAELNHDYDKAKELYYKAKDLDGVRFRASEDINVVVNDISEKYMAYLVPMLALFQENSPNGLIGNNLMTEHVHPNIDGIFIMADAFFSAILESAIVGEPIISQRITKYYQQKNYGYTILDSLTANHRIHSLKGNWPFVNIGEEIHYEDIYKPKNFLDSIAFEVLSDTKLALGTVRYELAKKYNESGDYYHAYKEYEAVLRTVPHIAHIYRDAATALINLSDLPLALKYFKKSLEFEESGFAYFKMAEIYFYMGDYSSTLACLQKAYPLVSEEQKVLVLAQTYTAFLFSNNESEAQKVANELKKINAENFLNVPEKKYLFNQYIPFQTRSEVLVAKQLLSEDRINEALSILEASLNDYDSHIVNRLIGQIYYNMGNIQTSLFYYEKVKNLFRFDPRFLFELTLVYHSSNEKEKAIECLDHLKQIDPSNRNIAQLQNILS